MAPRRQKSKVSEQENAHPQPEVEESVQATEATEATVTASESAKKRYGGARGVSAMYKVVVKKAQGKKSKVRCNELGVPIGQGHI
ncbi:hypothetical protein OROMI_004690 [Orobanche minor]